MTTCIIAHSTRPSTMISRESAFTIGASPSLLTRLSTVSFFVIFIFLMCVSNHYTCFYCVTILSFFLVYRVMRRANVKLHNSLEKERKETHNAKSLSHPNPYCEPNSNLMLNPDRTENCQKLRASQT